MRLHEPSEHLFFWVIEKHFWPTTNACSCHLHISLYPDSGWLRPHDSLIQKALNRDSLRYVSCWEVLSKDSTVSFQDKTNRWQLISSSSLYHHFCCWKWSPFVGFKSSVAGAICCWLNDPDFFGQPPISKGFFIHVRRLDQGYNHRSKSWYLVLSPLDQTPPLSWMATSRLGRAATR